MIKFACPNCGQSVSFDPPEGDQSVQCPHCAETLQLSAKPSNTGAPTIELTLPPRVQQANRPGQPVTQAQISDTTQNAAGNAAEVDPRVHLVLAQWEKAWRDGKDIDPAELVHDCPEILPQVVKGIDAMRALADIVNFTAYIVPTMSELPGGEVSEHPDVPGYEIIKELGHGGMGVVYQAHQEKLGRIVALKMLLGHAPVQKQQLDRFRREAKTIANLDHPNIVQLYDFGQYKKRPYFTLEFVSGGDLAKRLKREPLPVDDAVVLMEQLAHAIAYAHRRGVIHRDLKPQNILLAPDGIPKITDFGLVKQVEHGDGGTETDVILGSPPYMPPEQAQGMNRDVGPLADVYSLGAILYECLTGRPPFIAPTPMETLKRVTEEDPVPPRRLQPAIPRDVETVCLRCLQKEPEKRYESAEALAEDLRRIRSREPIHARPVSPVERCVKWVKRRPAAASLLGGVAFLAAVTAASVLWAFGLVVIERNNLKKVTKQLEVKNKELERERRTQQRTQLFSKWNSHGTTLREAQTYWKSGNWPMAMKTLEKCRWDLRGWVYDRLRSELTGNHYVLRGHREPVLRVAFNNDGTRLASTGADQTILIWNVAEKAIVDRWNEVGETVHALAFHPNNNWLATGGGDNVIRIRDAITGMVIRDFAHAQGHSKKINALAFSSDGTWIASAADDHTVKIWDTETGHLLQTLISHSTAVTGVAISWNDRWVIGAGKDGSVQLWQLQYSKENDTKLRAKIASDIKPAATMKAHNTAAWSVAFRPPQKEAASSRDHEEIIFASAGDDALIKLWKIGTSNNAKPDIHLHNTLFGHRGAVRQIAFSNDGEQIASASNDETIRLWKTNEAAASEWFCGHVGGVNGVAFHPNGWQFASAGNDEIIRIWPREVKQREKLVIKPESVVNHFALASGGTLLATATKSPTIQLWDTATGTLRSELHYRPVPQKVAKRSEFRHVAFDLGATNVSGTTSDGKLIVWNRTTRKVIDACNCSPGSVVFHPVKKEIAFVARDATNIELRDYETQSRLRIYDGHIEPITCLSYSATGKWLASGDEEGSVRLWDASAGKLAFQLDNHSKRVAHVAFSRDEKWIASAGDDYVIKISDTEKGTLHHNLTGHTAKITGLAFCPKHQLLLSSDEKNRLIVWHIPTEQKLITWTGDVENGVADLTFNHNGEILAFRSKDAVHYWRNNPPETICTICRNESAIKTLACGGKNSTETWLAYSTTDATVRVWNMVNGTEHATLLKHRDQVNSVAFAPKSNMLASADKDRKILLWQVGSKTPIAPLSLHVGSVTGLAFSRDGATLASSSLDQNVILWDVKKRRKIRTLEAHKAGVRCVAFHPNGNWLASGDIDGNVFLWKASDGTVIHPLKGPAGITSLAFGDSYLAASCRDGSIAVWNTDTGEPHKQMKANGFAVARVLFSPDKKWLLSAGKDESIHIWDLKNGKKEQTLHGHTAGITDMAFSSDGEWLITGDRSGRINRWQWNAYAPR